ncbi:ABC transporter ATP-binding protein [Streptomyces sp. NPDC088194]|uniref:ABC transporter ATP-binding protein n=1 Tax=Streptomyces sp. NPDC088194 TaxID=3154931 RepID=UPI00344CA4B8
MPGSTGSGLTATAAAAGAERLIGILDAQPSVKDPAASAPDGAGPTATLRTGGATVTPYPTAASRIGRLDPRGVHFGCPGAGKSTLLALLMRFSYDPDAGPIRLDGADLGDLPLHRLRQTVTLLPQRTRILSGSVRENIVCGRPGATDERSGGPPVRQGCTDSSPRSTTAASPGCPAAPAHRGRPRPRARHARPRPRRADHRTRLAGGPRPPPRAAWPVRRPHHRHRPSATT